VSDADGGFDLKDVQTGFYDLRIDGPWKVNDEFGGQRIQVYPSPVNNDIYLVPTA
jgi:hypothetical protein